jgi:hypothetical protein
MNQPLTRLQIEQLAQSNPRPLSKDEVKQLLKVQRKQPAPTIQLIPLGEPEPKVERLEIEIPKPKPGPKTSRQERNAGRIDKFIGLQLNPKQLRARNRRLRQLKNREKRPGAYQPSQLGGYLHLPRVQADKAIKFDCFAGRIFQYFSAASGVTSSR